MGELSCDTKRLPSRAALCWTAFLVASCGGGSGEVVVPFEPLTIPGLHAQGTYVVRSESELTTLLAATLLPFRVDPPPTLSVDFGRNMVVGVSLGLGRFCNVVEIKSVTRSGADYKITYKQTVGSTTTACGLIVPLEAFALVAQSAGNVSFTRDDA